MANKKKQVKKRNRNFGHPLQPRKTSNQSLAGMAISWIDLIGIPDGVKGKPKIN